MRPVWERLRCHRGIATRLLTRFADPGRTRLVSEPEANSGSDLRKDEELEELHWLLHDQLVPL